MKSDFSLSMQVDSDDVDLLAELASTDLVLQCEEDEKSEEESELDHIFVRIPVVRRELSAELENLRQKMRSSFRIGRVNDGLSHLEHISSLAVFSTDSEYEPYKDVESAVQSCIEGREYFQCGDFDHLISIGMNPLSGDLTDVEQGWIECWTEIQERFRNNDDHCV